MQHNMEKERLFKTLDNIKNATIKDKICMILSNYVDYGGINGAMLSVNQFGTVSECIIEYFKLDKIEKQGENI